MKKYILSLLIVWLSFIGFSNAQFITISDWALCSSYCSIDWFDSMSLNRYWAVDLKLDCTYSSDYSKTFDNYTVVSYDTLKDWCQSSWNWEIKGFKIADVYNWAGLSNVEIVYKSSKMPVSQLSPVVNWLKTSINEFIPYIVYIWLWILWVLIWFYAIKRLLRYVKWSTFSVFSSRRKK